MLLEQLSKGRYRFSKEPVILSDKLLFLAIGHRHLIKNITPTAVILIAFQGILILNLTYILCETDPSCSYDIEQTL